MYKKICTKVIKLPPSIEVHCLTLLATELLACGTVNLENHQAPIYLYALKQESLFIKLEGYTLGIIREDSIINLQNNYFASADINGVIKVWNGYTNNRAQVLETNGGIPTLAMLANG